MRRSTRPLPLLLVALGHALVVLLFLMTERRTAFVPADEGTLVYILPITLAPRTIAPVTPDESNSRSRPKPAQRVTQAVPILDGAPQPAPQAEPPGTNHLPQTDWQRELQDAARRSAAVADPTGRRRSLDSRPQVLELPQVSADPPPGTVIQAPNGDRTVRYKNGWTCTSSEPPLSEHFSAWAQFRTPHCTLGSKPELKLDVRKPAYLEQSLPELGPAR